MSVIKAWIGISVIPSQRNQQYLKDSARRFEKIIIHPDYNAYDTDDVNFMHDVALLKFDEPLLKKAWNKGKNNAISPICLPEMSDNEIDKTSYVTGWGLTVIDGCLTNEQGPVKYTKCAHSAKYHDKKMYGCIKLKDHSPPLDPECKKFNEINGNVFKNADEVVLVPRDGRKQIISCYKAFVRDWWWWSPQDWDHGEKVNGWCGTCVQNAKNNTPGYCEGGTTALVTPSSGWGYCHRPESYNYCEKALTWDDLFIVPLKILPASDCRKLLNSIQHNNRSLNEELQLCVGNKITLKEPIFYEYEGSYPSFEFKLINRPKDYKSVNKNYVPGLNYILGDKDSCRGDSGGPLWTRKGDYSYLVGVVSSGANPECGHLNTPGFYTRVTRYLDWIKKNAKDGGCKSEDKKQKGSKNRIKESRKKRRPKKGNGRAKKRNRQKRNRNRQKRNRNRQKRNKNRQKRSGNSRKSKRRQSRNKRKEQRFKKKRRSKQGVNKSRRRKSKASRSEFGLIPDYCTTQQCVSDRKREIDIATIQTTGRGQEYAGSLVALKPEDGTDRVRKFLVPNIPSLGSKTAVPDKPMTDQENYHMTEETGKGLVGSLVATKPEDGTGNVQKYLVIRNDKTGYQ